MDPERVLLSHVLAGDAVGVLTGTLGVVLLGDDDGRLDDAVFDGLGQRIIDDGPRIVHAVLLLGGGGEIEPERQPFGESSDWLQARS